MTSKTREDSNTPCINPHPLPLSRAFRVATMPSDSGKYSYPHICRRLTYHSATERLKEHHAQVKTALRTVKEVSDKKTEALADLVEQLAHLHNDPDAIIATRLVTTSMVEEINKVEKALRVVVDTQRAMIAGLI